MADGDPDSVKPLTGVLDLRSQVDGITQGGLRWRGNFATISRTEIRRRAQFEKFLNSSQYNNEDLHDQLLSLKSKFNVRQPITLTLPVTATNGGRYLFAATESTIYQLTVSTGNWRILGDGYGSGVTDGTGVRFMGCSLGDYVVFTNGVDKPVYYPLGQGKDPITGQYLYTFYDLDLIGLTAAKAVWQWRGTLFFGDVVMDGQRSSYRIVWSDFNNPISFDPSVIGSLTGTQDLFFHETVLNGAASGSNFLLYTSHAIWIVAADSTQIFTFQRNYQDDENRKGCLKYRYSLVVMNEFHYYVADDDIYTYNPQYLSPRIPEWVLQGSRKIMDEINPSYCENVVAGLNGKEIWISYPQTGLGALPTYTVILNTRYNAVDYMDYGFICFADFFPDYTQTLRQFIVNNGICSANSLQNAGYGYDREGISDLKDLVPAFIPKSIYTSTRLEVLPGIYVEDYTRPNGDADSLCALLGTYNLQFCRQTCIGPPVFLGVSSEDWCIKQIGRVFYREICVTVNAVGKTDSIGYHTAAASYTLNGFDSIIRLAPWFGKNPNQDVKSQKFEIEYATVPAVTPSKVGLRIGQASQIADPNTDSCSIKWNVLSQKPLICLSATDQTTTRPAKTCQWNYEMEGRFLFFEVKVSGTGGDCVLTRTTTTAFVRDVRNR